MVPSMVEKGYDKRFAIALIAAAGCLGTIIPPSIPMVMYGVATGASISTMFSAGILPGIVCGLMLIILCVFICKKRGFVGNGQKFSIKRVLSELKEAIWAIFVPVIILGGIYGGFFTPTEAAVVATMYSLLVGIFIYKELKIHTIYDRLASSANTTGTILIIVGVGTILGRVLTLEGVPTMIANGILGVSTNRWVILLLVNVLLLICGCLLETTSAILILSPILYPVMQAVGVDLIHFGIMMVVNLSIGFITPPVGVNLSVACGIGNIKFEDLVRRIVPFLAALLIGLILIVIFPNISLLIPKLSGYTP